MGIKNLNDFIIGFIFGFLFCLLIAWYGLNMPNPGYSEEGIKTEYNTYGAH